MQMEPLDLTTKSNPIKAHVHKPFSDDEKEKKKHDGEVSIHAFTFIFVFCVVIKTLEKRLIGFQGNPHELPQLHSGFPPALENLEKWDNFFQSGKSQGILKICQKVREF